MLTDKLKRMAPAWYGAAAGAAVAGAALFPTARLLAGLIGAGSILALGVHVTPCCDGCAAGEGCADTSDTASRSSVAQDSASAAAPAASSAPCVGCGQGASSPTATSSPAAVMTAPTSSSTALSVAHQEAQAFDGGAFLARFAR